MAEAKENVLTKVATTAGVNMKTAGETTLYTVPPSKSFVPHGIVVRSNSASLAGGIQYSFGFNTGSTWLQNLDLSSMLTTNGFRWELSVSNSTYVPVPASTNFVIKVSSGSTATCTATIDVWGYLI